MTAVIAAVVVVVVLAAGLALMRRHTRRPPDGITGFRRHMDALSSDARRDVIDRVRASDRRKEHHRGT